MWWRPIVFVLMVKQTNGRMCALLYVLLFVLHVSLKKARWRNSSRETHRERANTIPGLGISSQEGLHHYTRRNRVAGGFIVATRDNPRSHQDVGYFLASKDKNQPNKNKTKTTFFRILPSCSFLPSQKPQTHTILLLSTYPFTLNH